MHSIVRPSKTNVIKQLLFQITAIITQTTTTTTTPALPTMATATITTTKMTLLLIATWIMRIKLCLLPQPPATKPIRIYLNQHLHQILLVWYQLQQL